MLGSTRATRAGMPNLARLVKLRKLELAANYYPWFTAADFALLAPLANLQELGIGRMTLFYDGGLSHLKRLKGLKKLRLDSCEVSAADLGKLMRSLPGVQIEWIPAPAGRLQGWNAEAERRRKAKK